MKIKCNLKQILETKKISMYRLQKDTGVGYQNLQRYRDDTVKQFNREVLIKICKAIDCDLSEFLIFTKDN